jgi:hypothetical protein
MTSYSLELGIEDLPSLKACYDIPGIRFLGVAAGGIARRSRVNFECAARGIAGRDCGHCWSGSRSVFVLILYISRRSSKHWIRLQYYDITETGKQVAAVLSGVCIRLRQG